MKAKIKLAYILYALSVLSLLALWQVMASQVNSMILASPLQTLTKLAELLYNLSFWQQLLVTLIRLCYALTMACVIGFTLGLIAGLHTWLKYYLAPFRWLLMSVPPVIVVLLAMLWFGMGSTMVIFITVLLLSPTVYINTQKAVEQIDTQWLELAKVYHFTWLQRLTKIYIPAISAPLCSTLIIVCCNGVRIVVLAEVLGSHQGVGFELANASSNFDTAELYAWVTVSLLMVAFLELALLRPLQNQLLQWRRTI
ncbi:ABC transporter permease subunit [Colwellia sp. KU-HH00111]|uniref:ABC transporter permease n=1 Tax=Colwellia sp. KU-HH00111 TaxID=3127652 RepID=UPI0031087712